MKEEKNKIYLRSVNNIIQQCYTLILLSFFGPPPSGGRGAQLLMSVCQEVYMSACQ